jgi:enoyl-CoA hydratase
MDLSVIRYQIDDNGHAIVTIDRPDKLNALNQQVLEELDSVFADAEGNAAVKGVVVTGAGDRAFVAGADIGQFRSLGSADAERFARRGQSVFGVIEQFPKPVVAAINGFALGGGCELALACHFRIASENARLGQPEINLGIIPGYGGTQRLPRLIGSGRALEMILTGDHISATRALGMGLVNKVVALESLLDESLAFLGRITSKSPAIIRLALEAVRSAYGDVDAGMKKEALLFGKAFDTEDAQEGVTAFLEKRAPQFTGR